MLKISKLISVECMDSNLLAKKKEDAIAGLVDLLVKAGKIADSSATMQALLDREKLASTGIGSNVAIPHALLEGLTETVIAFGRSKKGIPFGSQDGSPAKLIFLIVGPSRQDLIHLQLLSRLARHLRDGAYRKALLKAKGANEILRLISQYEKEDV